jgi:hypothetical protein
MEKILRERVIDAVKKIYDHPPKLHFRKIRSGALDKRLRNTTTNLH